MGIIVEYQYFPPAILFSSLFHKTHLLLEQYESYQKMSFRNRCMVAGADGSITLSVPLEKGRNQKTLTQEIRIDNRTPWQGLHWKTIVSCYNRSPWFEFYRDELNDIYKTPYDLLADWDFTCFNWILQKLEFSQSVSLTSEWNQAYDFEKWDDWRNRLSPNSMHKTFSETPRYKQVFEDRTGFIPHLSVLDLLFCEGKNARNILGR